MKRKFICKTTSTSYQPARPAPLLVVHLLIWAVVFLTPVLLLNQHRANIIHLLPWLFISVGSAMLGFYINYLVLIPRLLFRRWTLLFFAANLGLFGFIALCSESMRHHLNLSLPNEAEHAQLTLEAIIARTILGMVLIGGVAVAIRMTRQWHKSEGERRQLEAEGLRSELSFLKLQLSPHFLFNTLNNITVLIDEDSGRAKESVLHLSKLLRSLLYEASHDTIPVQSEVRFLESYVHLMRLRFGPELDFSMDVALEDHNARMAPLLLMPLVENAFKHGVEAGQSSHIHIHIATRGGELSYVSTNTHRPKTSSDKSGSGVGVANLRKRLRLLYPGRHSYITQVVNDTYTIQLRLALEEKPLAPA